MLNPLFSLLSFAKKIPLAAKREKRESLQTSGIPHSLLKGCKVSLRVNPDGLKTYIYIPEKLGLGKDGLLDNLHLCQNKGSLKMEGISILSEVSMLHCKKNRYTLKAFMLS